MQQTHQLIALLKKSLKSEGITYAEVAIRLSMSEAGVKRLFSRQTFTLKRFEEIAEIAGTNLSNLASALEAEKANAIHEYTLEQETYFAKNPGQLAVFDHLLRGKSTKKVLSDFQMTKKSLYQTLQALENLNLIRWLPNDRVKVLVTDVQWRKNGPLRKRFVELAKQEFLMSSFSNSTESFSFALLELSKKTSSKLRQELSELLQEFQAKARTEKKMGINTQSFGILLAMRPWNFSVLPGKKHKK